MATPQISSFSSTLTINRLTEEQYQDALSNGYMDDGFHNFEFYLTEGDEGGGGGGGSGGISHVRLTQSEYDDLSARGQLQNGILYLTEGNTGGGGGGGGGGIQTNFFGGMIYDETKTRGLGPVSQFSFHHDYGKSEISTFYGEEYTVSDDICLVDVYVNRSYSRTDVLDAYDTTLEILNTQENKWLLLDSASKTPSISSYTMNCRGSQLAIGAPLWFGKGQKIRVGTYINCNSTNHTYSADISVQISTTAFKVH